MTTSFTVETTTHFERLLNKLVPRHPELTGNYRAALTILESDPYNRQRQHNIKKLENVAAGDGQYRLRIGRWRFRYDISGQTVILKRVSLRREDTYRN